MSPGAGVNDGAIRITAAATAPWRSVRAAVTRRSLMLSALMVVVLGPRNTTNKPTSPPVAAGSAGKAEPATGVPSTTTKAPAWLTATRSIRFCVELVAATVIEPPALEPVTPATAETPAATVMVRPPAGVNPNPLTIPVPASPAVIPSSAADCNAACRGSSGASVSLGICHTISRPRRLAPGVSLRCSPWQCLGQVPKRLALPIRRPSSHLLPR